MSDVTSFSEGAVTWEPIQPGEPVDYDMTIGSNSELRVVTELGDMVVEFDDDIRLCRATPAPTWSQEPPTEEGDYWWWTPMYAEPQLCEICVVHGSLTVYDDDGYSSLLNNCLDRWWLPATVPQPPTGEVRE